MSLRRRLLACLNQRPKRSIVQVVYVGYPGTTSNVREENEKQVLTVSLPPREVVSDQLLCRIQDGSSIKRRRVFQAHSWEMFCPVKHIGRRKLGHNSRQYFCVSPVVNAGRFSKQKADPTNGLQLRALHSSGLKYTRLNSSDWPKARVMSANVSMTDFAASSMSCRARKSLGFVNSCSSENL